MLIVIAVILLVGFCYVVDGLHCIDKKLEKLQKTRKSDDS